MIMAHLRFLECSLIFSLIILIDGNLEGKTFREPGGCCKPSPKLKEWHVRMTELAFKPTSSMNLYGRCFLGWDSLCWEYTFNFPCGTDYGHVRGPSAISPFG